MKFENKINIKFLEEALVNWVLGNDGQDGATCEVLATIPWTNEMEKVTMWSDVCEEIDEAIGRRDSWDVYRLIFPSPSDEDVGYKREFYDFISKKVSDIVRVYDNIINKLNEKLMMKSVVVFKYIFDGRNMIRTEIDRIFNNTFFGAISDVWFKYGIASTNREKDNFYDSMYSGENVIIKGVTINGDVSNENVYFRIEGGENERG